MKVGIDLGTTNSLVAIFDNEEANIIPNKFNEAITPSVVSLLDDDSVVIGKAAKERTVTAKLRTASAFKRHMGTKKTYTLGRRNLNPIQLSSLVLKSICEDAEIRYNQKITSAIITVPAYFTDNQRKDTIEAAKMAGLKVEGIINEPTAAALAYQIHESKNEKVVVVVDFGGGTLDVSLLDIYDSVVDVQAVSGNNFLGGEDFDLAIAKGICTKYQLDYKQLSLKDKEHLKLVSEEIKKRFDLDKHVSKEIHLDSGSISVDLTYNEYEMFCLPIINKIKEPIRKAVMDSGIDLNDIDEVILVGGSTKMPIVKSHIAKLFGKLPLSYLNPDEVVAKGAAIYAAMRDNNQELKDTVMTDVCPYSLGIAVVRDMGFGERKQVFDPIIERNMTIPISLEKTYSPTHEQQNHIRVKVYQGESRNLEENVFLGDLKINIIPGKHLDRHIIVRFTYDSNGILEVLVKSISTGEEHKAILLNNNLLSQEEIEKCMEQIAHLKVHPRDNEENLYLISKAEKLFELCIGDKRELVEKELDRFLYALNSQDLPLIAAAKQRIKDFLVFMDGEI